MRNNGSGIDEARYAAVYGACIARQVFDYIKEGRGPPDDEAMDRFVEEAECIAVEYAEPAYVRACRKEQTT